MAYSSQQSFKGKTGPSLCLVPVLVSDDVLPEEMAAPSIPRLGESLPSFGGELTAHTPPDTMVMWTQSGCDQSSTRGPRTRSELSLMQSGPWFPEVEFSVGLSAEFCVSTECEEGRVTEATQPWPEVWQRPRETLQVPHYYKEVCMPLRACRGRREESQHGRVENLAWEGFGVGAQPVSSLVPLMHSVWCGAGPTSLLDSGKNK